MLVVSVESEGSLRGRVMYNKYAWIHVYYKTSLMSDEALIASGGLTGDGISS